MILVTGAAGFIGMTTSLRLLARGDEVVGVVLGVLRAERTPAELRGAEVLRADRARLL